MELILVGAIPVFIGLLIAFGRSRVGVPTFRRLPNDPRIGAVSDRYKSGYSHCERCKTNWGFVEGHTTQITWSMGMFPLCEHCWGEITPAERVPFYRALYTRWGLEACVSWAEVETAVLAEQPQ